MRQPGKDLSLLPSLAAGPHPKEHSLTLTLLARSVLPIACGRETISEALHRSQVEDLADLEDPEDLEDPAGGVEDLEDPAKGGAAAGGAEWPDAGRPKVLTQEGLLQ